MNCRVGSAVRDEPSLRGALAQRESRRSSPAFARAAVAFGPSAPEPRGQRGARVSDDDAVGAAATAALAYASPPAAATRAAASCRRSRRPLKLARRAARCRRLGGGVLAGDSMSRQHYTAFSCALRDARVCAHDWAHDDGVAAAAPGRRARRAVAVPAKARGSRRPSRPRASPATRAPRAAAVVARYVPSAVLPHGEPRLAGGGADWLRLGARRRARARPVPNIGMRRARRRSLPRASLRALLARARAREAAGGAAARGRLLWRETSPQHFAGGRYDPCPWRANSSRALAARRRRARRGRTAAPPARAQRTRREATAGRGARRTWAPLVLPIFARGAAPRGRRRRAGRRARARALGSGSRAPPRPRRARSAANHDEHMALRDKRTFTTSRRHQDCTRKFACRRRRCGTRTNCPLRLAHTLTRRARLIRL